MPRPNIIVIMPHDTGRHFGCYGATTVHSPNIDALAATGVKFTNMFSTSTVCSPSRASLLTGCHPQTHGLMSLVGGNWNWKLKNPRMHLSHVLRDAGYHTRMYGFQDEALDISDLGFDHHSSFLPTRRVTGQTIDATTSATDLANFLKQRGREGGDQPFFAQIGFVETHTPYDYAGTQPDDSQGVEIPAYAREDNPELAAHVAAFQGSIRKADEGVGIILDALKESGLEQDTLVLFAVDHGAEMPHAKWTMYDAGLGVGFILRWPGGGLTGGRECSWMLSNIDFLPSLAEWLSLPPAHSMDGTSFATVANAETDLSGHGPHDAISAMWSEKEEYAVRTADYKLIRKFKPEPLRPPPPGQRFGLEPAVQLYHLPDDPYEQHDVSADPAHADALKAMNQRFYDWIEAVDDPIRHGPIPTPYYQAAIADYRAYANRS